jgi:hypothetical protein
LDSHISEILNDKSKNIEEKIRAYQRALVTYTEEYNRFKKSSYDESIQPVLPIKIEASTPLKQEKSSYADYSYDDDFDYRRPNVSKVEKSIKKRLDYDDEKLSQTPLAPHESPTATPAPLPPLENASMTTAEQAATPEGDFLTKRTTKLRQVAKPIKIGSIMFQKAGNIFVPSLFTKEATDNVAKKYNNVDSEKLKTYMKLFGNAKLEKIKNQTEDDVNRTRTIKNKFMEILEIVSGPEYDQMMQGSGRRYKLKHSNGAHGHGHSMKAKHHLIYKNFF